MGWYSGRSEKLTDSIFRGHTLKGKKQKQVYAGNEALSHAWASGNVEIGRSHNMFFIDGIIYSYGYHFKAAQIFDTKEGKVVLINSERYSVSTGKHLTEIESATSHLKRITVPRVNPIHGYEHEQNVEHLNEQIAEKSGPLFTLKGFSDVTDIVEAVNALNDYLKAFKLNQKGLTLSEEDVEFLKVMTKERDGRDLAKRAAKQAKQLEEREALEALHKPEIEKMKADFPMNLDRWRAGAISYNELRGRVTKRIEGKTKKAFGNEYSRDFYINVMPDSETALLRVIGNKIETSQGASVPLEMGIKLLKRILNDEAKSGERVGHFEFAKVEQVENDKLITIGCHEILLSEAMNVLKDFMRADLTLVSEGA